MSREILLLVDALAREKNVHKEVVFGALEMALASATKKRFNEEVEIRVAIDRETGEYESFRRWQVVSDELVEFTPHQIAFSEAQKQYSDIRLEEFIEEQLEPIEFGRIGAQAAKQVILQRIRHPRDWTAGGTDSARSNHFQGKPAGRRSNAGLFDAYRPSRKRAPADSVENCPGIHH